MAMTKQSASSGVSSTTRKCPPDAPQRREKADSKPSRVSSQLDSKSGLKSPEIASFADFRRPTPEQFAENERRWAELQAQQHAAKRLQRVGKARVPRDYRKACLKEDKASEALRAWMLEPTAGVVLTGAIGAGKTYLACALLAAYMDLWECSGRFVTATSYIDACLTRDCTGENKGDFFTPKILVLDDLGKEKASEYVTSCLFQLLDTRLAEGRKTIITTNYTGRELMYRLAQNDDPTTAKAFASRLKLFSVVHVDGDDRRRA